jgi:hypothetical protein
VDASVTAYAQVVVEPQSMEFQLHGIDAKNGRE